MYANTGDEIYLPDDRNMAQQAVNKLYYKGLFRGHSAWPIVLWTIAVIF